MKSSAHLLQANAVPLSPSTFETASNFLETIISQSEDSDLVTFTWNNLQDKLHKRLSTKSLTAIDKKRLKSIARKCCEARAEMLNSEQKTLPGGTLQELVSPNCSLPSAENISNLGSNLSAVEEDLSSDSSLSSDTSESSGGLSDSESSDSMMSVEEDYSERTAATKLLGACEYSLLQDICSKTALKAALAQVKCTTKLKGITRSQIQTSYTYLRQIEDIIKVASALGDDEKLGEIKQLSAEFCKNGIKFKECSESGFIIDSHAKVEYFAHKLRAVSMISASNRVLVRAKKAFSNSPNQNYLNTKYKNLHCHIKNLKNSSSQWESIERVVQSTRSEWKMGIHIEVSSVFSVDRVGEGARFSPFCKLPNRKLLWYPVPAKCTLGGLLSEGVRPISPDAPTHGLRFGKSIALYDTIARAIRDIETQPLHISDFSDIEILSKNPCVHFLLCEVACGLSQEKKNAEFMTFANPPNHSVKGLGRLAPSTEFPLCLEEPVQISAGPLVDKRHDLATDMHFNEYHVYDVGQVRMKYLVELKLHQRTN